MRWEGFYEDIDGAGATGLMDHYGAENTVVGLLERNAPGDLDQAVAIFDWSTNRYLAPDNAQNGFGFYAPALLEWDAWPNTTYAATGQWAITALWLDRATAGTALHDPSWKPDAIAALNTLTYGQGTDPLPADDRMITTIRELTQPQFGTETWYEQNFNTAIYGLRGMDLAPELAPQELRLLGFDDAELRGIQRDMEDITASWSGPGVARFKSPQIPVEVRVGDTIFPSPSASSPGWSWDPAVNVAEVRHDGSETQVSLTGITAVPPLPTAFVGTPFPNPFNPRVTVELRLPVASTVRWTILDTRGRRVTAGEAPMHAGAQRLRWDGVDHHGQAVASGTYRWRIQVGAEVVERTLTLVR
ncbi:MAG: hypothetical protein HKO53_06175 [Gemmatimonadetes bacterium]|nr:hypothetical protein [Gemmatimonadota bacterium]